MTMPDVSVLDVLLHGEEIGTLTHVSSDQTLFAFNQAYIDDPERLTLSLSFKGALSELITDVRPTKMHVPPFFANLLPEGPLRSYLAKRAGVNPQREFFLLWVLGQDLPGALIIQPADGQAWPPSRDLGGSAEEERRENALRFSLAGVQLKFSAIQEAADGGLTIPAQGIGGSWIVKLPSVRFEGVPENEYAMMTLARTLGMDVPDVKLIDMEAISGLPQGIGDMKGQALAVKRFDRTQDQGAVHIEDFAQVFSVYPEDKYNRASYRNIANVIWTEIGEEGIIEFVRRLVFSTLIGNGDMHLKNWSLIYPDRRHASLAPAYDFVSTIPYIAGDRMALKFSRSKRMADLTEDELSHMAAKAKLPEKLVLDSARETVECFREAWVHEKRHLPLTARVIETIETHLQTLPIYSG
jgi:serine/threonine-protein kinase HipA